VGCSTTPSSGSKEFLPQIASRLAPSSRNSPARLAQPPGRVPPKEKIDPCVASLTPAPSYG
jgi:hypothetical protein